MKICIIGISGYGRVHYHHMTRAHAAGEVELVGATVINQEEEAEKCAELRALGCRLFEDYTVMLREVADLADVCVIPTGTPLHRSMTVAALEAGMHVFVEKPAAGSLEDVQAMRDAAQKANRRVAVGYQHLYSEAAIAAKHHLLRGTLGELTSIKCLVTWPRGHSYYARNGWAGKLTVQGTAVKDSPFNNAVAHDLMMMLFLAGTRERAAATPVSVDARLYRANEIESADTASLRIETEEGIPLHFYCTHACRERFGPEIQVRGTAGTLVMTHKGAVISPSDGDPIDLPVEEDTRDRMFRAAFDAFRGGDSFICDLEMASRQTQVVEMAHRAGEIQTVPAITVQDESPGDLTVIPGIESALRQAFEAEGLAELVF